MKTRSIAAALLFAFTPPAIGFVPATAHAQQADDPTTKAARARFQEGVAFFDKGEFENARAAFLQAYALRKHPAVLLNLAQSCLRSGHALEAARYFQQYLRESSSISPAQRADAERGLNDARQKLGRIDVSAPTGANVTVDGEGVGTAPLTEPVDVEPGSHKVKAGNDEVTVSVNAGQKVPAKLGASSAGGAVPLPPPPTPAPAPAPAPAPEPPKSNAEPSPPSDNNAGAPPGADTGVHVEKKNLFAPPASVAPVIVGGVASVIGFGVAIGVGVIAKSSAQSAADNTAAAIRNQLTTVDKGKYPNFSCSSPPAKTGYPAACAQLSSNNSNVDTDATVGNIGLAVGIAGAAFALGWWMFAPKKEEARTASTTSTPKTIVTPILGTRTGGLAVSGEF